MGISGKIINKGTIQKIISQYNPGQIINFQLIKYEKGLNIFILDLKNKSKLVLSEKAKEYIPSVLKYSNTENTRSMDFNYNSSKSIPSGNCHEGKSLYSPNCFENKSVEKKKNWHMQEEIVACQANIDSWNRMHFRGIMLSNSDIVNKNGNEMNCGISIAKTLLHQNKEPTKLSLENANRYAYKLSLNKNY